MNKLLLYNLYILIDQKSMTLALVTILLIHSHFLRLSFLGGKRKGEKNNQSHGQKSCLSTRSYLLHNDQRHFFDQEKLKRKTFKCVFPYRTHKLIRKLEGRIKK